MISEKYTYGAYCSSISSAMTYLLFLIRIDCIKVSTNIFFLFSGALLNASMLPNDVIGKSSPFIKGLKGRLEVHLKVNHDNNTLTLGLSAKACVNSTCLFSKPVFNRTEIPGKICFV